jgi:hypothetical protein
MVKEEMAYGSPDRASMSSRFDFSPPAQRKAQALAAERGVKLRLEQVDVHTWEYPDSAIDVVVEIFTQFSSPPELRSNGPACERRSSLRGSWSQETPPVINFTGRKR